MALILKPAEAEAVYSAICALNNVNVLHFATTLRSIADQANVKASANGAVFISTAWNTELYNSQAEFAAAYNLS